ncbi:MAG TPA: DUF1801 domain-containing protein [Candidatus Saccharimonadales bacterium]
MAKTDFKNVDEYLQTLPAEVQEILQTVRQAIHAGAPEGEEVISYQIPAIKDHGFVFYFSAFKNHYSLSCPPPFTIFSEFEKELAPYKKSKSTIQFPFDKPVPIDLITRMAVFRVKQNRQK